MIGFRYKAWDEELARKLKSFADLLALFHHILLQQNGDVSEALRMMKRLRDLGYIDRDIDLDQFARSLEEGNLISLKDGVPKLTTKGERFVRKEALNQIFTNLKKGAFGEHRTPHAGDGGERLPETRPWNFGDDLSGLDLQATMRNALRRTGADLALAERDFELHEREHTTSCATVLMVDVSHSMVLYGEDRITPAQKVAIALTVLIRTRSPQHSRPVVLV